MIVVDANVIATGLADGPNGDSVRARLRGQRLVAPQLLDLEVVSVWRRLVSSGALNERRAEFALRDLADLRIDRIDHLPLLARRWELRHSLTIHDAAYVAVAELLGCTLLTGDNRHAAAPGISCDVELATSG